MNKSLLEHENFFFLKIHSFPKKFTYSGTLYYYMEISTKKINNFKNQIFFRHRVFSSLKLLKCQKMLEKRFLNSVFFNIPCILNGTESENIYKTTIIINV